MVMVPLNVNAEADRLRDELSRCDRNDFFDQLAELIQHRSSVVRVQRGQASRVTVSIRPLSLFGGGFGV
jgi:hypothetical protein